MSLLSVIGISDALAATNEAGKAAAGGGWVSTAGMLLIFVAIFYFLLVRPQTKRAKNHRQLMSGLSVGDEIMTSGGIVGRLSSMKDNYIVLTIAKGVDVTMQKNAIASVLPKGTMDSLT